MASYIHYYFSPQGNRQGILNLQFTAKKKIPQIIDLHKIPFPLTSDARTRLLFFCSFYYPRLHVHKEGASLYSRSQFPFFFSENS